MEKFTPSGYYSFGPCGIISHKGYVAYVKYPDVSENLYHPYANLRVLNVKNKEVMESLLIDRSEAYKQHVLGFAGSQNNIKVVKYILSQLRDKKAGILSCLILTCADNKLPTAKYLFKEAKEISEFVPINSASFSDLWNCQEKQDTNRFLLSRGLTIDPSVGNALKRYCFSLETTKQLILYGPDIEDGLEKICNFLSYDSEKNRDAEKILSFFLQPKKKRMEDAIRFDRILYTQSFIRGL